MTRVNAKSTRKLTIGAACLALAVSGCSNGADSEESTKDSSPTQSSPATAGASDDGGANQQESDGGGSSDETSPGSADISGLNGARLPEDSGVFGDQVAEEQIGTNSDLESTSEGPCEDTAAEGADPDTVTGNSLGDEARAAYISAGLPEAEVDKMHWATSISDATPEGACRGQVGVGYRVDVDVKVDASGSYTVTLAVTGTQAHPIEDAPEVNTDRPLATAYIGDTEVPVEFLDSNETSETARDAEGNEIELPVHQWTGSLDVPDVEAADELAIRTDTGFLPDEYNAFTFYDLSVQ